MSRKTEASAGAGTAQSASWLSLLIIVLAQIQMAFNVNALPISLGPIADELMAPATTVGTALVIYSLFVAAFVLLGAKIGQIFGERLVFQVTALLHGLAMGIMALSPGTSAMFLAQAFAGLAAAALVPTLVVLIAASYHGKQQTQALGVLAGTPALSGALAFFIAGYLGTALSWRLSFGLLAVLSVVVFALSFRLRPIQRQSGIKIDAVGAILAAAAIILISFGFNGLHSWGILLAKPAAPVAPLGLSPAPLMILLGIVLGQGFFFWSHRQAAQNKTPLLSLEVLDAPAERSAVLALLIIGALGSAVIFLIPLYIQIVQGRSSLFTAVATVPYTLSIAAAAILTVRLYAFLAPRWLGIISFVLVATGLTVLSVTVRNEWTTYMVILSLILVGLGEGTLVTLLFNVLVSSSPKELAGEVGALRGVANNLAGALGTAFAAVAAVGLLSLFVTNALAQSSIQDSLKEHIDLDNVNFVTNDQLESYLDDTPATEDEVDEAVQINEDARLRALKTSFLILAGISLLALVPTMGLPNYIPGEVPSPPPPPGRH